MKNLVHAFRARFIIKIIELITKHFKLSQASTYVLPEIQKLNFTFETYAYINSIQSGFYSPQQ